MLDIAPLLRRRHLVTTLALAVGLAAGTGVGRLELDNGPEGFFAEDDRALAAHRELVAAFGSDRTVRVVIAGDALWTDRGLGWLGELEERLTELPGVLATAGPFRLEAARGDRWPPADPEAFRARLSADPVARGAGWVTADGSLVTVLVVLARAPARGAATALGAVEAVAAAAPPGLTTRLAGLPVVERAFDEEASAMMTRFLPLLGLLLTAALAALFRRSRQVSAVAVVVVLVEATTLGAMGWSGARLDVVTALLLPLLAVVATATAVHLLVRFRELRADGLEAPAAARELITQKAAPVTWAGLTTIAAFASLVVAPVPAIRSLGIWAAFGFACTTLAALALMPCLLAGESGAGVAPRGWTASAHRLGHRWAAAAVARRRVVTAVFVAAALLALAGALRLRPAHDLLGLLGDAHPVRVELAALESAGLGTAAADLVLTLPREPTGGFHDGDRLARLADLGKRLRARPAARGVVSAGDLVATWRRPEDGEGAASWQRAHARSVERPEARRLLGFLVTRDGRRTRVPLAVPMADPAAADELFTAARAEARAAFPGAEVSVTGTYPLILAAQRSLLETMLASFALALVVVAVSLRLVLGSAALAGRALVANLWPVLVALGVMGWARVPLDSSTVAVAAIALGLAVDDSLHTFADFRRHAARRGARHAVIAAVGRNAPAHLATALLLAGGLVLFGLSGFLPAVRFGLLTAAAVGAALVADLLLVPALLATAPGAGAVRPGCAPTVGTSASTLPPRGAPAPGG